MWSIARGGCGELLRAQQLGNSDAAQSSFAQTAQDQRQRRGGEISMLAVALVTIVQEHDVTRRDAG